MEKKATLLIKNLDKIYTLQVVDKQDVVLEHAYLALHHDIILAMGTGDYQHLIDKDTRVLDGNNHYAIPGLIESCTHVPVKNMSNQKQRAYLMDAFYHGILNINITNENQLDADSIYYDTYAIPLESMKYPVLSVKQHIAKKESIIDKQFCLSTYDTSFSGLNMIMLAQVLALSEQMDAMTLLKAMTLYPAINLNLHDVGVLKVGNQADILLVYGNEIASLFDGFHEDYITQIIKKGVRLFPNKLI